MKSTLISIAAALAALATPAFADDTIKLAVGQRGNWDTSPAEIGQQAGIFKKHGLALEIVYTQGGADIGVGVGTTGLMTAFVKGAPVRPIGNATTGADDLFWYVPANSPIKTPKDGAGKTISYSTTGSSTHIAVLAFIKHFGVEFKPTAVGSPPSSFTQTMSGQVDIGWSSAPFGLDEIKNGRIRILMRESEVPAFQNQTVRMNIANMQFITTKKPLLDKFVAAYRETLDAMYSDPKLTEIWSKWTNVPLEIAKGMRDEFFPKKNLEFTRVAGLDDAMADAVAMKFFPAPLTKEQLDEMLKYYAK